MLRVFNSAEMDLDAIAAAVYTTAFAQGQDVALGADAAICRFTRRLRNKPAAEINWELTGRLCRVCPLFRPRQPHVGSGINVAGIMPRRSRLLKAVQYWRTRNCRRRKPCNRWPDMKRHYVCSSVLP
ncbi:hypothetical protein P4S72_00865 [Vibrio sp. PP-XX7]